MVYESRVGDVFTLGTTSWRIEDITHDRVLVSPAPGQPGRLPFWTGDTLGRPAELGAAVGQFTREVSAMTREQAIARATDAGLDEWAADNLVSLIEEQKEATQAVPHDQQLVVERFRDELGDWRLVVHSPFGTPVHSPWALAINARLRERYGVDAQAMATDDGIVLRIPETDQDPPGAELIAFEPDEIEQIVTTEVGGSALFASRFRECAARALLLPRRDPGRRAPLWQQRQRSAQLLAVAARYPSFPIILETVREVLQDLYDLPSLVDLHRRISERRLRLVDVNTQRPSPFAQSLLFGYVAAFMYEGDSPIAERRAAALTLDQGLLAELLGRAELRELLDPEVLAEVESELQRLAEDRRVRDNEGIADLLRMLGPLSTEEIQARCTTPDKVTDWVEMLVDSRRVVPVLMSGQERWAVVEDVARLRDGLGVPVPPGVPDVFTEPVEDPLGDLVGRYARTHGPFSAAEVAERLGLGVAVCHQTLARLAAQGRVLEGEFRPSGSGAEWCDAEVLRSLRRRSLARLRHEVEPVEPAALARFLPAWQNIGGRLRGVDGVVTVIEQLAGCAVPASALESLVLPSRVADYQPSMLDELSATGEVLWAGHGGLPGSDGWVSLHMADTAHLTLPDHGELERSDDHEAVLEALSGGGAYFFRQLATAVGTSDDKALSAALWDLAWSGRVGNDTLAPLACPHQGRAQRTPGQADARTSTFRAAAALGGSTSIGATRGRGPLVPAAAARDRPHQAGTRDRREPARAPRRGHPRRGDERAHARWFRRDLPRARGVRGDRTLPTRLLRGGARRCPVRYGGRHRPAAHLHEHRPSREADGSRARRDRPGQPVRRGAAVAAAGVGAPARAQGGRDRRAGGRRTHSLRRARRQDAAHLHRGRGGPGARHRGARPRRTRRGAGAPHRREGRRRQHPGPGLRGPAAGDGVGRLHRDAARTAPEGLITVPEGDTVYQAAKRLDKGLTGQVLTKSDFRIPSLATSDISGATVTGTISRGKHLLTRFDNGLTLRTHLKMEGTWHVHPLRTRWRRPAHTARVILRTATTEAVGFQVILDLVRSEKEDELVGHLGPDLLGPDWDAEVALARLRADPTAPIGDALLEQRNLAGIGNVFKSELCFLGGVDPLTPVGAVPDLPAIVAKSKQLLEANKDRPTRITTGDKRRGYQLWVYGRRGPCLRCGTPIQKADQGKPGQQRPTYWCPSCQPRLG